MHYLSLSLYCQHSKLVEHQPNPRTISNIFKILYIDKSEIVVNHAFAIRKINKEERRCTVLRVMF